MIWVFRMSVATAVKSKHPTWIDYAENGLRFTNFYNTGRCWPTRAALITGYYAQQVGFDLIPGEPKTTRGPRPPWAPMLPERLRALGYRSYHSGKWHLDGLPLKTGQFDRSYLMKDQGRYFNPNSHSKDDISLPPVKAGSDFYITSAITDHAVEVLKEHQDKYPDKPFFHFLAYTALHFPLQALPADIAKYEGQYDVGWNEIRRRRWKRVQELGLVTGELSAVEPDVGPPYDFPDAIRQLGPGETNRPVPWESLTTEQKKFQAKKMELHAAMVDRVDQGIGQVLTQLASMQQLENTLIMFLSDNGASAEIMVRADGHDPSAAPGSAKSYLCLGPGWSNACNTPFRRHKTWVHEGGIHTPMIMHWPNGIRQRGLNSTVAHVIDIVPTVLELTGANPQQWVPDSPPFPGLSLLSTIRTGAEIKRGMLWWYHEGNRAIRLGDWKLVAANDQPWELIDLHQDPTEQQNLILERPEKAKELEDLWTQQLELMRRQVQSYRAQLESNSRKK